MIKSYTDLSQSKKLAEILQLESADMHYGEYYANGEHYPIPNCDDDYNGHCCWSLAALLGVLPYPSLHKTFSGWRCDSYNKEGTTCKLGESLDNPVDACVAMIIKLHELNLL